MHILSPPSIYLNLLEQPDLFIYFLAWCKTQGSSFTYNVCMKKAQHYVRKYYTINHTIFHCSDMYVRQQSIPSSRYTTEIPP
jgi:hypothetical protein